MIDPHTAVGVHAGLAWQTMCMQDAESDKDVPAKAPTVVAMACAHPGKFSEVVCKSTGLTSAEFWEKLPNLDNPHVAAVTGECLLETCNG
jgi:threonine synthase